MVQLSCKVISAHELHMSDLRATLEELASNLHATLEQHASDLRVRYACLCKWFAGKRRLAGKILH